MFKKKFLNCHAANWLPAEGIVASVDRQPTDVTNTLILT